jgi:hypothetical protein
MNNLGKSSWSARFMFDAHRSGNDLATGCGVMVLTFPTPTTSPNSQLE